MSIETSPIGTLTKNREFHGDLVLLKIVFWTNGVGEEREEADISRIFVLNMDVF
jgi:hypothetical protein